MARRLPFHGNQLTAPIVDVHVLGKSVRGYVSDSLAVAAFAENLQLLSRSLKYHRPRGAFCFEGHCSGCLMRIDGEPNQRACQTPCTPGAQALGQNGFPSVTYDVMGAVDHVFGKKLDHHTLMTSATPLNWIANRVVRQLSGLGTLPDGVKQSPAVRELSASVVVIGAGPAGLAAAIACATSGVDVVVIDDQLELGGSLMAVPGDGPARAARLVERALAAGVNILPRSTAIGWFPEEEILAVATPERLIRVEATAFVWAGGGYPANLPVADNDRPGVIAARAVGRLLMQHHVLAGDRIAIIVDDHAVCWAEAEALAIALREVGATVTTIALAEVEAICGTDPVTGVDLRGGGRIECDVVAMAALPSPASEGPRQHGCKVVLDPARGGFRVVVDGDGRTSVPAVWACGDITGYLGPTLAQAHGEHVGATLGERFARRGIGASP